MFVLVGWGVDIYSLQCQTPEATYACKSQPTLYAGLADLLNDFAFPEWFCIFWLARVAAPSNSSWSNTFSRDHPNNKDFFENYVAMTQCKLCIEYTSKGVIGLHLQFLEPCWAISSKTCPKESVEHITGGKRLSQGQREEGRNERCLPPKILSHMNIFTS